MYASAKMLIKKSLADGFLVGSRGSVGSSFAATMAGITEVNPLPPHYICPECKYLEWGDANEYDCGIDLPEKRCPVCGTMNPHCMRTKIIKRPIPLRTKSILAMCGIFPLYKLTLASIISLVSSFPFTIYKNMILIQ